MPANYDMIISQSPPVFSHSPPTNFFNDFTYNYRRPYEPPKGLLLTRPQMLAAQSNKNLLNQNHMRAANASIAALKGSSAPTIATPKRSCLLVRTTDQPEWNTNGLIEVGQDLRQTNFNSVERRKKKSVIFADDKGLELTQVKIMSEPSNVPPYWSLQFLAEVTHGLISPVPPEQWTVDFRQPASDYLEFRKTLDEKKLSLENVIVKETEALVVGTIKVQNLDFSKEVIVRVTYDSWKSQEDIFCVYSSIGGLSYAIYDTFSFKLTLPAASKRIEFCICFRCNDVEYWDSNNGKNYTLSKRMSSHRTERDGILTFANNAKLHYTTDGPDKLTEIKAPKWTASEEEELLSKTPYW